MAESRRLQRQFQRIVDKLGLGLTVLIVPDSNHTKHGEIGESSRTILIYDIDEMEAWKTFQHELYEYRFKEVMSAYRSLVNCLITFAEKQCYEKKEAFLDFLPKIVEVIQESKRETVRRDK